MSASAGRASPPRHGGDERGKADRQQDRQRDEAALAERAGHCPRFDAAADVDLHGDHQQRAPRDAARMGLSANRQDDESGQRQRRERRPEEETVLRRGEHFERVRRLPVHLPRHEPRRPEAPVERLVGEELREQANREGEAASCGDENCPGNTGRAGLSSIDSDCGIGSACGREPTREVARALPRAGVGPREL